VVNTLLSGLVMTGLSDKTIVELHESLQAELNLAPVQRLAGSVSLFLGWIALSLWTPLKRCFPNSMTAQSGGPADPSGEHKKRKIMQVNLVAAEEEYTSVRRRSKRYCRRRRKERLENILHTIKVNGKYAGRVPKGQRAPRPRVATQMNQKGR